MNILMLHLGSEARDNEGFQGPWFVKSPVEGKLEKERMR